MFALGINRPHSDTMSSFLCLLNRILHVNVLINAKFCVIGGFNMNLLGNDTDVGDLMNFMQSLDNLPPI